MSSIVFRGARIRYVDLRIDSEAGVFARLHMQADLTGPVREALGWERMPEGMVSAKLSGKLTARNLVMTPNQKDLRRNEFQVECSEVGDFQAVPEKDEDDGSVVGHRLNFIARSIEVGAISAVENYLRIVGSAEAALKVAYEAPEQLELAHEAGVDDGDDDQPDLEAAGDDAELGQTFEEALEAAEEREPSEDAGPLPSAVTMAGNTDKLKRQRRARTPRPTSDPGAVDWDQEQALDPNVPHSSMEVM